MDRRSTGDPNTGGGNTALAIMMIFAIFALLGIPWSCFGDGDDCLIFCEAVDYLRVRDLLVSGFLEFGQELTLDNVARDVQDILFCQSRLVCGPQGWRMVRDWRKVLSHSTSGVKHWNNPNSVRGMLTAVGSCLLAECQGIPILQELGLALKRMGRGETLKWAEVDAGQRLRAKADLKVREEDFERVLYSVKDLPIDLDSRLSFSKAWGVSPSEQKMMEDVLRGWNLDSTVPRRVNKEWDWRWEDMSEPDCYLPTCL